MICGYAAIGGNYHIQNVVTGNCMRALSDTDFAVVDTIDSTGISNENWSIQVGLSSVTPNLDEIRSHVARGNRCLDVQEGSFASGTPIDIFHCITNLSRNEFSWAQIFST
jgi:hypothetical protein